VTCVVLSVGSVCLVSTTKPSRSSFGMCFSAGSRRLLRARTASSRWSVQVLGSFSRVMELYSSSLRFGVQSHLRTCKSSLLVPSTRPLIYGEYAATT